MLRIILMGSHMNAIDDRDNLVGFDTSDDCCAHGGWFVSDKIEEDEDKWAGLEMAEDKEYPDYRLDTDYFKELGTGEGGAVVFSFRCWGDEHPPLYLHLFNCHNGYYSKGFSSKFGGKHIEGNI